MAARNSYSLACIDTLHRKQKAVLPQSICQAEALSSKVWHMSKYIVDRTEPATTGWHDDKVQYDDIHDEITCMT